MSRESSDRDALSGMLAIRADILLAEGDPAGARAPAEESLALGEQIEDPLRITEAQYLLATAELRSGRRERVPALLLAMRDELRRRRVDVRVSMLVLVTAEWAASAGDELAKLRARGWLSALSGLQDIDATVRAKARRLLGDDAGDDRRTLADLEAEVDAYLDGHAR